MTTVTLVSNITRTDGTTEEFRGYSDIKIEDSIILWVWPKTVIGISTNQIRELVATEEHTE